MGQWTYIYGLMKIVSTGPSDCIARFMAITRVNRILSTGQWLSHGSMEIIYQWRPADYISNDTSITDT